MVKIVSERERNEAHKSKPIMILFTGISGAGKTYFAKKLAEATGFDYFGIDEFYTLINGSPNRHENEWEVWMAFYRAIHMAELEGRDIIVDTNAPLASDRAEFICWFQEFDHYMIYVSSNANSCMENMKLRERVVPDAEMQAMITHYEEPSNQLDNSNHYRGTWLNIYEIGNARNVNGYFSPKVKVIHNSLLFDNGLYSIIKEIVEE